MSLPCTRCDQSGFLNGEQMPGFDNANWDEVLVWMEANPDSDVMVCDCCGNGESWHGEEPGRHTTRDGEWEGGIPGCI